MLLLFFALFFFLNRELSVHITRRPCDVNVGVAPIDYRTCAFPRFLWFEGGSSHILCISILLG